MPLTCPLHVPRTRVCRLDLGILVFRLAQARRARSLQMVVPHRVV